MTTPLASPTGTGSVAEEVPRLFWIDLARGLAVVSMIVAHTSPWGGLWNVSEYLTAPLFAFLVGLSLHLAWLRSERSYGRFVLANVLRGLLLVGAGELLQLAYWAIIVVLQWLGVLTIVLAPLVPLLARRPWAAYAVSLALALLSPVAMASARLWVGAEPRPGWVDWSVEVLAAGQAYRVTTFIALAAAGIAITRPLLRHPGRHAGRLALLMLGLAATSYLVGRATVGADPYSGTTPEIVGAILLCSSVATGCWWIAGVLGNGRARHWLAPLAATGRMALSAYALQILALAVITRLARMGDDHWAIMTGVTALCIACSWAWLRLAPLGPLEAVLRLPSRLLARWPTIAVGA